MPVPFAPLEKPRQPVAPTRYAASDAAAKAAAIAELTKGRKAPKPLPVPRKTMLTIKPDATVHITTDGSVPDEALFRTREQIAQSALISERGRLLRDVRRLEDVFLRSPSRVTALKLAQLRERVTGLELAAVGIFLEDDDAL